MLSLRVGVFNCREEQARRSQRKKRGRPLEDGLREMGSFDCARHQPVRWIAKESPALRVDELMRRTCSSIFFRRIIVF
ncbi:MAG: hypothetical protein WBH86_16135, partial [Thermogutta sp.]